ncbi:hypothetical protein PTTG_30641, partial [Puccinia triticina 1-1 BBBD Race 1]
TSHGTPHPPGSPPTPPPPPSTPRAPQTPPPHPFLGTALLGLGWAADRYLYAEAVARTLRLAYNAGLTIVDYKLNFSPDRPADELHARVANRLAACCERNGGLYIKLGQAIAIQAALLPPVYTHALASIFDAASPMPFQLVRQVCSRELPGGIDRHFETFDPTPIACGSIAQVHRATLKGSATPVAVKVQRPDHPHPDRARSVRLPQPAVCLREGLRPARVLRRP